MRDGRAGGWRRVVNRCANDGRVAGMICQLPIAGQLARTYTMLRKEKSKTTKNAIFTWVLRYVQ